MQYLQNSTERGKRIPSAYLAMCGMQRETKKIYKMIFHNRKTEPSVQWSVKTLRFLDIACLLCLSEQEIKNRARDRRGST